MDKRMRSRARNHNTGQHCDAGFRRSQPCHIDCYHDGKVDPSRFTKLRAWTVKQVSPLTVLPVRDRRPLDPFSLVVGDGTPIFSPYNFSGTADPALEAGYEGGRLLHARLGSCLTTLH